MRLLRIAIALTFALALSTGCYADIITLKNGRIVNGTYLGGTARQIRVEVGDNIQTIDVGDVARIEFNGAGSSASASRDTVRDTPRDAPRDDNRPTLRRADDSGSGSGSGSSSYPSSNPTSNSGGNPHPVILQPDPNDTGSYPGSSNSGSSYPTDSSRPTLKRSSSSGSSDSSSSSSSDSNRPVLRRSSDASTNSGSDSASAPASNPQPGDSDRPLLRRSADSGTPAAPTTPAPVLQIPQNTEFIVRMIDAVDSQSAKEGDVFRASLDQPIVINGATLIPRDADAQVKLVRERQAGKLTGKAELTLSLWSVTVNGKVIPIDSQNITKASNSKSGQTAKAAGGAAAAGAIIGAIAGGGKGAAVGAGAGAAAGTAAEALTKGPRVKVASETLLTFVLEKPVDPSAKVPAQANTASPQANTASAPAQANTAPAPAPAAASATPPPAPAPAPPSIKVGQSQDSVVAALGQPDSVDATGDKQIYIYKNVKVTFVNGKVSKVE